MSTKHVVHKIIEPGLPGDGFTAPEAAAVRDGIARVDPGTTGTVNAVLVHGPNGPRWVPGVINAATYGMATTNTANQNKLALEAAIDAAPNRGMVYIPRGYYLIENLKQYGKTISLIGDGRGYADPQLPYGGPGYSAMSGYIGGTTLAVISTSGIFLDTTIVYNYGNTVNLENINLVGVGDATRTNQAVRVGQASGQPTMGQSWRNVLIVNFAIGMDANQMYWSQWGNVEFRGCRQAFLWDMYCNQNTISQLLIASCGATGYVIADVKRSESNTFTSMTFQTNQGGIVFRLAEYAHNNKIGEVYSENPGDHHSVSGPIASAIEVQSTCERNRIGTLQLMKAEDVVKIRGNYNHIIIGRRSTGTSEDTGVENAWDIQPSYVPSLATNYPGLVQVPRPPKLATGSYTVTLDDDVVLADSTNDAVTVNLPALATQIGRKITITKINSGGSVTVKGNGSELINTSNTYAMTERFQSVTLVRGSARWYTIASHL